jgi:ribosomal protein S7
MSQTQREDHAMGWLAENARASFNAAAVMQVQLASGILAQRSAQAQPQEASGIAGSKPVGGA